MFRQKVITRTIRRAAGVKTPKFQMASAKISRLGTNIDLNWKLRSQILDLNIYYALRAKSAPNHMVSPSQYNVGAVSF